MTRDDVLIFDAFQKAGGKGDLRNFVRNYHKCDGEKVKAFMARLTGAMLAALNACKAK